MVSPGGSTPGLAKEPPTRQHLTIGIGGPSIAASTALAAAAAGCSVALGADADCMVGGLWARMGAGGEQGGMRQLSMLNKQ